MIRPDVAVTNERQRQRIERINNIRHKHPPNSNQENTITMSKPLPEWPAYLHGQRDHYHALGVITANFNSLEHRLLGVFMLYLGFDQASATIFRRVRDNNARVDFLRCAATERAESDEVKDAVLHFCTGFEKCAQNRNTLVHAGTTATPPSPDITHLVFTKAKKNEPIGWNRYFLDLPTLRRIADQIYEFSRYGEGVFYYLVRHYHQKLIASDMVTTYRVLVEHKTLPEKPVLPELLTPQPDPVPNSG